ncbi:MAG: endo-1,4-beta-xylanase [Colwellia sp.]|nr:endo-1,4-beta-xylanase [Colwellia sp.]
MMGRRQFLASSGGLALSTCLMSCTGSSLASLIENTGLKEVFKDKFTLGTAVSTKTLSGYGSEQLKLIAQEFNSITPENDFKWEMLRPSLNNWHWDLADKFVEFGQMHDMQMVGHALVWHSQIPENVFFNNNNKMLSRPRLLAMMEEHINTVVGRYRGKIQVWDVVNEAFKQGNWRKSHWYNGIGEDYFEHAFRFAAEADPKAQLLYNDYGMDDAHKQQRVIEVITNCRRKGVKIDGIGMQSHLHLDGPSLPEIEQAILAYANAGLRVHITELEIDVLPQIKDYGNADIGNKYDYREELDPYKNGLPLVMEQKLAQRYEEIFKLYIKHSDKIDRVTLWGTSDDESWKNDFPIKGRSNYPLLFDRNQEPKLAYHRLKKLSL